MNINLIKVLVFHNVCIRLSYQLNIVLKLHKNNYEMIFVIKLLNQLYQKIYLVRSYRYINQIQMINYFLDEKTVYYLNPSGKFEIGGPQGDAGLTGRKIIVDTYGGWGAHGGGAFSGKDPSKVDRSGAYAARWVAKSLVKAKLCRRCLVQISYSIAIAEPLSIAVFAYGTSAKSNKELLEIVKNNFDLRPGILIR